MIKLPVCADCKHSYTLPASAKYRRCAKVVAVPGTDDTLCGSMRADHRKGGCGPDGKLFEVKANGQA